MGNSNERHRKVPIKEVKNETETADKSKKQAQQEFLQRAKHKRGLY